MKAAGGTQFSWIVALVIIVYFGILFLIGWLTSRKNKDNHSFFTANKSSKWYVVAFGMIGTSISGITFISIPGQVNNIAFSYFQVVLGYLVGYMFIILVLLPLYYRLNLVSIYSYLESRFGKFSYKTGAFYFLASRTLGSAVRLMLATMVFQIFLFDAIGLPYIYSVTIIMLLILLYSIRGGVKTIIWTDNLQTLFLVLALILTLAYLLGNLKLDLVSYASQIIQTDKGKIFFLADPLSKTFFWKQFLGGVFITIAMTGMDQDLMQKNLTVRTLRESQKNMFIFSLVLVAVNALFLLLGSLLFLYCQKNGIAIPNSTDYLFPKVAMNYLPLTFSLIFLIGLTAATFASTDSAMTALVTSFCVDILGFNKREIKNSIRIRYIVHSGVCVLIVLLAWLLYTFNDKDTIDKLMKIAGYTYGPLVALFLLGIYSKRKLVDKWVPIICLISPGFMYIIELNIDKIISGYKFGYEVIIFNVAISIILLLAISKPCSSKINLG